MESFKCEECEKLPAEHYCEVCQELLCSLCDKSIHSNGNRRYHFRVYLCKTCPKVSNFICSSCLTTTCSSCLLIHNNHELSPISSLYPTVVYWDLSIYSPDVSSFFKALGQIKANYPKLSKIKVFGSNPDLLDKIHKEQIFEILDTKEDMRVIFIDISLLYQFYGHFVIITNNIDYCKPYLQKILATVTVHKIKVAYALDYLTEINVEEIQSAKKSFIEERPEIENQEFQEKVDESCRWITQHLKSSAENGKIAFEYHEFVKSTAELLHLTCDQLIGLINYLEEYQIVSVLEKQFTVRSKFKTISLKITNLNTEVLNWVISSLKLDEMLPSERAILARVKEAFDYKPRADEWPELLETCMGTQSVSYRSKASDNSFSFFSSQEEQKFKYRVKKYKDPVFNNETYLIYPVGQKWTAYDKYLKCGDVLSIKTKNDWTEFRAFFLEYFSSGNLEDKAIPGGRYGCAQFLKHFSTEDLKVLSLGKLNYMIQLAIDEDLLRYQKNLLVWTACLKVGKEDDTVAKVKKVSERLVFVLGKYKEGISLAQLPGVLNCNIEFQLNLQELGYAKLKDLLMSVPGVKIVRKANKHQYAVLAKNS